MIKVFIDTNICLDLLQNREPHAANVEKIFELAHRKEIDLYASALSLSTIYYLLKKSNGHISAMLVLQDFTRVIQMLRIDSTEIDLTLISTMTNFDDAVQYYGARTKGMDYFITRNAKDFPPTSKGLRILKPTQFLRKYK